MDEIIMVEVCVPAAKISFDLAIPQSFTVAHVKELLYPVLATYTQGNFIACEDTQLYAMRFMQYLNDTFAIKETGLQYGDEIIIW